MAAQRIWLDWNEPCLSQAAAWVFSKAKTQSLNNPKVCDLQNVVCIVPVASARGTLIRELVERCREHEKFLVPPKILTPKAMIDELLPPVEKPVATKAEMSFAWIEAIRKCDRKIVKALLPTPLDEDDLAAWKHLAHAFAEIDSELAAGRRSIADVAQEVANMPLESERWQALEKVHQNYKRVLEDAGLKDRHAWTNEGIERVENDPSVLSDRKLILIGVDLNELQKAIVRVSGDHATILIHAPNSIADRFDDVGCVMPEAWQDVEIDIGNGSVHVVGGPRDQAQAVLETVASFKGSYSADDITIGFGDRSPAGGIQRQASWAGLALHDAAGEPLSRTAPCRFLQAAADWLSDQRFATFTTLLRHPNVEQSVGNSPIEGEGVEDWLGLLDKYFDDHLHERFTGAWLGNEENQKKLSAIYQEVQKLLKPLTKSSPQQLGEWAQPITDVLASIYDDRDPEDQSRLVCKSLCKVLAEWTTLPSKIQSHCDAATAIDLLLSTVASETLQTDRSADEIEMLGWLDVHLDPAPSLILAGFNDGDVPQTNIGGPFLNDLLRTRLGLANNARRYARDAYLFQAICKSRKDLTIISGRRSAEGDPLTPSRLLLACDNETLLTRVRAICSNGKQHSNRLPIGVGTPSQSTQFSVPELPSDIEPREYMRVTEFRTYLQCPYRYVLDRVLKLDECDRPYAELDAQQFGSLAHEVLETFGSNESVSGSVDADEIEKFLIAHLHKRAKRKFGDSPSPAVRVQIANLEQRFRGFAHWQARSRCEGWVIKHCELPFNKDKPVSLEIPDEKPMRLHARIDRIDFNEETKTWRVIDYKTGDSGRSPVEDHHDKKTIPELENLVWTDLQLPLYHYLVLRSDLGVSEPVELGYIVLPKRSADVEFKCANWDDQSLAHAVGEAQRIVGEIRSGQFDEWKPNPKYTGWFDAYARICQTKVLGEDDDGGGDE